MLYYNVFGILIFLITFSGTPPIIVLSGTSLETTALYATSEFLPTVTPGKIIVHASIHAFLLI